jgi:ribonuclease HII
MTEPKSPRKDKTASLEYEQAYIAKGFKAIVGMDEAGRGPWAGPVTAGAVALPLHRTDLLHGLHGIRDSKDMTARQRQDHVAIIHEIALAYGVGFATVDEIIRLGIMGATKLAMHRALQSAHNQDGFTPDCLFLDYMQWREMRQIEQLHLTRGDALSLSIACASVLAKTARDAHMLELAQAFPQYGFDKNKGYGTAQHSQALDRYGVCPAHRTNFAPIRAKQKSLPL